MGPYSLEITIGVVLVMCFVNLRGLREAGRPFAIPTYFFTLMAGAMIVVGVIRQLFFGGLPQYDAAQLPGAVPVQHGDGLVMGATVLVLLRAFANGGSSLTGVEAISNTVSALKEPAGRNGRKVLTAMALILGFLVAGVSYLAFATHATPFQAGYPSVLSQEARAVFGGGAVGDLLFYLVQIASALILFTGANTSFNGFPFMASFVAEDRFLPRQLTKRGHRLVFSNGIMTLTVLSVALLLVTGGSVTHLVPFYAIGVFTGFAMAGYGMTRHHLRHREPGWRRRLIINLSAGLLSTLVVGIFAVAKFTEGAWLVVVIFPILVFVLIRLNREYRAEISVLQKLRGTFPTESRYAHQKVFLMVGSVNLALLEALRYARTLQASQLRAVHLMTDSVYAERLHRRWERLGIRLKLEIIDCPDRRVVHATQELVARALEEQDTAVTVLLPRRNYAPFLGRLLHDHTADRVARGVSRLPHAVATIVPYDVQAHICRAFPGLPEERLARAVEHLLSTMSGGQGPNDRTYRQSELPAEVIPIDALIPGVRATVEGRVDDIMPSDRDGHDVMTATVTDDSGQLLFRFTSSKNQQDVLPGVLLQVTGRAHQHSDHDPAFMTDPSCTFIA